MLPRNALKIAWTIVGISVLTDMVITVGSALTSGMVEGATGELPATRTIIVSIIAGIVVGARTLQQELKATGISLHDVLRAVMGLDAPAPIVPTEAPHS